VAILYLGEYTPGSEFNDRINTLSNLRIELSSSKHLVAGSGGNYFSAAREWLALLENQQSAIDSDKQMPDALRRLSGVGILATRFEAAVDWDPNAQVTATIAQDLTAQIPIGIRTDSNANWSLWPGTKIPWEIPSRDSNGK